MNYLDLTFLIYGQVRLSMGILRFNKDTMQKYAVNQQLISTLLSWVQSGEIAIPEIQRPFVWESTKVRNLMDSLYKGYPIGYIITWKNPDTKLKDGTTSIGRKIVIDGQQRITAMRAGILGLKVVNKRYKEIRIIIAFNPVTEEFATKTPAIEKDPIWISDISKVLSKEDEILDFVEKYLELNPIVDKKLVQKNIQKLFQIKNRQIGVIDLDDSLDIETVTDIFVRINSEGVVLSQADFAMSKIASNETYDGAMLRKCIDYFSHLCESSDFYKRLSEVDTKFTATKYYPKLSWVSNENIDLYVPDYNDILRVAFTSKFQRGRLSDLVSLLSGRNFETREFQEDIVRDSFNTLSDGVLEFVNETDFKRFVMIIRSAGFIDQTLIRSQNVLNFAYILYLVLRRENYKPEEIETYVRKWFVMSILTKRYSGSPESAFDYDVKRITNGKFPNFLQEVESASLSEAFWTASIVQSLDTSVASSPYYNVFLASQVKANNRGFLSKDITITDLINHRGDIHHIFPRDYLKKNGLTKSKYNQIANYVYMQSEINIKVGNKAPIEYFNEILEQIKTGSTLYGGILNMDDLKRNLAENCVPESVQTMNIEQYEDFLKERRILIAQKIKEYYFKL